MVTTVSPKKQSPDKRGKGAKAAADADKGLLARAGRVAAAKAKRPAPKDRPDYIGRTRKYFQSVVAELKRVHWPGVREVVVYTVVVVLSVALLSLMMWVFDQALGYVFHFVTKT